MSNNSSPYGKSFLVKNHSFAVLFSFTIDHIFPACLLVCFWMVVFATMEVFVIEFQELSRNKESF